MTGTILLLLCTCLAGPWLAAAAAKDKETGTGGPKDEKKPYVRGYRPPHLRNTIMPNPPSDIGENDGPPIWHLGSPDDPFGDVPPQYPSNPLAGCNDDEGWSFEIPEDSAEWTFTGVFERGPVFGNAVHIDRIAPPGYTKSANGSPAKHIGGDYWAFSRDVNQQGNYWLGSRAVRPLPTDLPGQTLAASAEGTATSPDFTIVTRYLHFVIGGTSGRHQRVQLEVLAEGDEAVLEAKYDGLGVSEPPIGALGAFPSEDPDYVVVRASSALTTGEFMQRRVIWDLAPFFDRQARIVVVDSNGRSAAGRVTGHINADEFVCDDDVPGEVDWIVSTKPSTHPITNIGSILTPIPLWGTTDTHAHPLANVGFAGHLLWGDIEDDIDDVYDCRRTLPKLGDGNPDNGGRPSLGPVADEPCKLDPLEVISPEFNFMLFALCAFVPNEIPGIPLVCPIEVGEMVDMFLSQPLFTARSLHGSPTTLSGGLLPNPKVVDRISEEIEPLESFSAPPFVPGLLDRLGWDTDEGKHSQHNIKTHQTYQKDMILRAWQGGLRLIGIDVLDNRAISEALGGPGYKYDEWRSIRQTVKRTEKLVECPGGALCQIAGIAKTPAQARELIASNKIAIVLGVETEELGIPRFLGDNMELQVADLYALGIRKITPIHALNNPLGGAAMFNDVYSTGTNEFANTIDPDSSASKVDVYPILFPSAGLLFGDTAVVSLRKDRGGNTCGPGDDGNSCEWYDVNDGWFDLRRTTDADDWIDPIPDVTFRIGFDSVDTPLARATNLFDGAILKPFGKHIIPTWPGVAEVARIVGADGHIEGAPLCNLDGVPLPIHNPNWDSIIDPDAFDEYDDLPCVFGYDGEASDMCMEVSPGVETALPHMNNLGLRNDGVAFLESMMRRGMVLDLDHLSQKARVDAWEVAEDFGADAVGPGVEYPMFAVHTDIRGVSSHSPAVDIEKIREDRGFSAETDRTVAEFERVREHGGAFSPSANGSHLRDHPDLATDMVRNDCDYSSKSFALKYLWMVDALDGRGVTPSTDMSPFFTAAAPRFGQNRCHLKSTYADNRREGFDSTKDQQLKLCHPAEGAPDNPEDIDCRLDRFPHDWDPPSNDPDNPIHPLCAIWGKYLPECPTFKILQDQYREGAGVVYEDYAKRDQISMDNGVVYVTARTAKENRDDGAPREKTDEKVAIGRARQMAPMKKFQNKSKAVLNNAGWDINLDGMPHIGLYPDFLQDVRNVGVSWEYMTPLFNAAEEYVRMWEQQCELANGYAEKNGGDPACLQ